MWDRCARDRSGPTHHGVCNAVTDVAQSEILLPLTPHSLERSASQYYDFEKVCDGTQVAVPDEVSDSSMEVKSELLVKRVIVEWQPVLMAPLAEERPVDIAMRSSEGPPAHFDIAVRG